MTRESTDELAPDGTILNGYDYRLQNWVENGVLIEVGNCREHWGKNVKDVPGHEVRKYTEDELERFERWVQGKPRGW